MCNPVRTTLLCAALLLGATPLSAAPAPGNPQQMMKQQLQLMTPNLRQRVQDLSPDTRRALIQIYTQHTRHSDRITLRQVMHEVLADYQAIAGGIMTDNPEQAADAARRLANHRIPRGGLLPYLKPDDVTDDKLGVLVPFNDEVEGNARRLAEAADKGDMATAGDYFGRIATGCVGCHQVFRGQPGRSPNLQ